MSIINGCFFKASLSTVNNPCITKILIGVLLPMKGRDNPGRTRRSSISNWGSLVHNIVRGCPRKTQWDLNSHRVSPGGPRDPKFDRGVPRDLKLLRGAPAGELRQGCIKKYYSQELWPYFWKLTFLLFFRVNKRCFFKRKQIKGALI